MMNQVWVGFDPQAPESQIFKTGSQSYKNNFSILHSTLEFELGYGT